MMPVKKTAALAACLLLLTLLLPLPVHAEGAHAMLLTEAATGCVLAEENADTPLPVGSLAKLMTAYLAGRAIEAGTLTPETSLTAGESVRSVEGAVIWLCPGDTATVEELLLGLLIGNANDAAAVLAERISGSSDAFVMDMNAAAFDLGMRDTHFTTPQGYDDPAAYSTARDMGKLACAVLRCDALQPCLSTWRIVIREDHTPAELVNENALTRTYDGCCGLKAAHSPAAGCCVIAAARRGDMTCAAVVLGCEDADERFAVAKKLLNSAFSDYQLTVPGFSEEFLMPLRIRGGTENAVLLKAEEIPLLAVPNNAQPEAVIVLPEYHKAPVRKGMPVGRVCFYSKDTLLCETALVAAEDVPVMTFRHALAAAWRAFFR
ncbi:MAG: D-alanyl-D-alanine carboxypeptidase [Oscillospiraceae bacterium]|nr:D-alanyl-D-alanine carboxypeptidase [Oscillospiraceae bacterium]